MGKDSLGTEYEPQNEDEGVSDSESSLESEFSVDEGLIIRTGRDAGRCRFAQGEGPSGGQCRPCTASMKINCKFTCDGEIIELDRVKVTTDVGQMVHGRTVEWEREGDAWDMVQYIEDIEGMGQYNWYKKVWRIIMETIEDIEKKLCDGPSTDVFADPDKKKYPCIASWARVDHAGRYDASELLVDIKEEEVIPIMYPRDAELVHPPISQLMAIDEFDYYVDDGLAQCGRVIEVCKGRILVGEEGTPKH
ncbi:hypothetical protein Cgig2_032817 [Carnegiea gigantea]|uniref:Uncharacterized protein n=1 Tax=Carnegiea gigantea TaxID=171969 RepID=A0A9Q1GKE6_9CARY|nr:hypothetical protein Cgig2_032817 [Carnegiea gigantea]